MFHKKKIDPKGKRHPELLVFASAIFFLSFLERALNPERATKELGLAVLELNRRLRPTCSTLCHEAEGRDQ